MDISFLLGFLIHLDENLALLIHDYGLFVYPFLFVVVFFETGIVFTPFLPGDSLIFIAGALAGAGLLDPMLLFIVFSAAAILGDTANYSIGKYSGKKILKKHWIKEERVKQAEDFFRRHGGKTIVIARFMPFIRTFVPFVAGIGSMNYRRFIAFNVAGGLLWVASFLTAGYLFGNIPMIKDNLTLFTLAIIAASFAPAVIGLSKKYLSEKKR
ncbi:MAG: VTT domain-containing protein [Candidatus Aenigmatarchaeota archaeon]